MTTFLRRILAVSAGVVGTGLLAGCMLFAIEHAATWTRIKQVYFFNRTAGFAEDWHRAHVDFHNGYRLVHNLKPSELHAKLIDAQQKHHEEMLRLKYWDHSSPVEENKSWDKRIRNAGYEGSPGSENLAMGSGIGPSAGASRQSIVMWFWDPHHYPLVNPSFNQIGPGAVAGMQGCSYGSSKLWQSAGLPVDEIDLSVLVTIDHATLAAAFSPRPARPGR